jgi:2-dehydropantoate 2-reductase
MSERVLVAGCGAVGSVFACLLRAAGHEVTILARGEHAREAAERGLLVTGIWGDHAAAAIAVARDASELEREYDAVLITCKSYQTRGLLAEIGDRASSEGVAISLQNGLGNVERVAAVYGRARSLAGRVIFGAELSAPGRARVTVEAEPVLIGRPGDEADARVRAWATRFDAAGIRCEPTPNILGALWGKVFYNAALNPLGALLGLSYGELAESAQRRRVMSRVIEEAYRVAAAERTPLPWASVDRYLEIFYERLVPATAKHRSSMLQDLEKGRPTEIDAICGEVCRRGDASGTDVSLNRLLTVLVCARGSAAATTTRSRTS